MDELISTRTLKEELLSVFGAVDELILASALQLDFTGLSPTSGRCWPQPDSWTLHVSALQLDASGLNPTAGRV